MELFFDTETTGMLLFGQGADHPGQPDIVQLAMILSDKDKIMAEASFIVDARMFNKTWKLDAKAAEIHGITEEDIKASGLSLASVLQVMHDMLFHADTVVCHNTSFDIAVVQASAHRSKQQDVWERLLGLPSFCTMQKSTSLCKLPGKRGYKWPKLQELHQFLFNEPFTGAHDALADVRATRRCYYELKNRGL